MDETIGAKGGKNDLRRSMIIEKNKKKKMKEEEKELKDLEKRVKKQQRFILIKALPIALTGGVVKTIYDTIIDKKERDLEEDNSKWRIKEYDADITTKTPLEDQIEKRKKKIIVAPDGRKVVIYVTDNIFPDKTSFIEKDEKEIKRKSVVIDNELKKEPTVVSDIHKDNSKKNIAGPGVIDVSDNVSDNDEIKVDTDYIEDFDQLDLKSKEKLEKIKAKRIVSEYETKLKDLRYELRNVIYDYSELLEEEKEILFVKDAEYLIDKLSDLIRKIDELKNKIKIENINQYDDNYIYYLIQDYFDEFKNKKVVSEIKDSPLYIMIEEKLNDLAKRKDELEDKLTIKKEKLIDNEKKIGEIKDKYYSIDKINQQLEEFQVNQERLLRDIKEKIDNSKTVKDRVHYQLKFMDSQTNRLANIAALQMIFPGPRFIKRFAFATAMHINYLKMIMRPQVDTKRYKEVLVKDYAEEIKSSISSIDDNIYLLNKTSKDISDIINELKEKYKDYSGVMSEYDSMLYNLYKIQSQLEEKEYEMQKIKLEQEKQLERNNAKVLTRGTYPVN